MCGIVGVLSSEDKNFGHRILKCLNDLSCRGPDGYGLLRSENLVLGHTRLKIIDESSGADQPMLTQNDKNIISYNGEIYNYKQLRNDLISNGLKFESASDTEVMLKGFSFEGYNFLKKIEGMFAIAFWNKSAKTITLARDHFGQKPLYFSVNQSNTEFVFGSSPTIFKHLTSKKLELEDSTVPYYLMNGRSPTHETMWKNIHRVQPGQLIEFKIGSNFKSKYFFDLKKQYINQEFSASTLFDVVSESIKLTTESTDVDLGYFVSGGLDSAIVTSVERQNKSKAWFFDFPKSNFSEIVNASATSQRNKLDLRVVNYLNSSSIDIVNNIINSLPEPLADTSLLPYYILCREASKEVKVVIGGDGSDELFFGYPTYNATLLHDNVSKYIPKIFINYLARYQLLNSNQHKNLGNFEKVNRFINGAYFPPPVSHSQWRQIFPYKSINQTIPQRFMPMNYWEQVISGTSQLNLFQKLQIFDMLTWLPNDILMKLDSVSMANSLEIRSPFLNQSVFKKSLQSHANIKPKNLLNKSMLKDSFLDKVNSNLIRSKKKGFSSPINQNINKSEIDRILDYALKSPTENWITNAYKLGLLSDFKKYGKNQKEVFALAILGGMVELHT